MAAPRFTDDEVKQIIDRIRDHVDRTGDASPAVWLKAEYPTMSTAMRYRLVDRYKRECGIKQIDEPAIKKRALEQIQAQMPAPLSPAVAGQADPTELAAAFDFLSAFRECWSDVQELRAHARKVGEDGKAKIVNPMLLDKTIARRVELVESMLGAQETIYNQERTRELYQIIIEELGKASVELQRSVLYRLRRLNKDRGFTLSGMGIGT